MAILRQKRGPSNPTNWRRLALATVLRYATPAGQGKTKTSSTSWTLRSPFQAIDWLPFAPPRWLPIPRHSQNGFKTLKEGQKVTFDVTTGPKGICRPIGTATMPSIKRGIA